MMMYEKEVVEKMLNEVAAYASVNFVCNVELTDKGIAYDTAQPFTTAVRINGEVCEVVSVSRETGTIAVSTKNGIVILPAHAHKVFPYTPPGLEKVAPTIGAVWEHKSSGKLYLVVTITNLDADAGKVQQFPPTVVYVGQNGKVWSRPYTDFCARCAPTSREFKLMDHVQFEYMGIVDNGCLKMGYLTPAIRALATKVKSDEGDWRGY